MLIHNFLSKLNTGKAATARKFFILTCNTLFMKHLLITVVAFIPLCNAALCQSPQVIKMQRINTISDKVISQKKDPMRLKMYRVYSQYFAENNIYPNTDAIDLVEAYNKQTSFEDIETRRKEFKAFILYPPTAEMKARVKLQPMKGIANVLAMDIVFKNAVKTFRQKQQLAGAAPDSIVPAAFKNSVALFSNQVLPRIENGYDKIPAVQIEFFTASLQDINTLMDALWTDPNQSQSRQAINEIMEDFASYKIPSGTMMSTRPPSAFKTSNTIEFYHAAYIYDQEQDLVNGAAPPETANANVYVYTRTAEGTWDQSPKPFAFNVNYGPNGLKYSLKPGCDTLSFFKFRPTAPASTLPVLLAKGSYCFVLEDVKTHQIYLRPDINLRDNKLVDDTQLIKLCFKVEN